MRWKQVGGVLPTRGVNAERDDVIHGVCTGLTTEPTDV